MKRVFLLVPDSLGIGEATDAALFGDEGAHTLRSISASPYFHIPNLLQAGLGNIRGLSFLGKTDTPQAAYARMRERSAGKDTTVGHWEIAGLCSQKPLPTYPNGFPQALLDAFTARTGYGVLCNRPYSGTQVIHDYGDEHLQSGKLIVYTSADSVFQIAAHERLIPLEELYRCCRIARELLTGEHAVGRVIARPFIGESGHFTRTGNRRDFSLTPPGITLCDLLAQNGLDVISVGKISDIFAGKGITRAVSAHGNTEAMQQTLALAETEFGGLCFVNLVDFDMLYGHRNDIDGYAKALAELDAWLPALRARMQPDDLLILIADHGCDPGYPGTDHTREDTPLLVLGDRVKPVDLGVRDSFADVSASVLAYFGLPVETEGSSFTHML